MDQKFIELLLGECIDPNLSLPDPELVQYYQNLENRIIWLDGEITSDSLDIFSKILYWNREDKEISIKDRKPIKIFINSVGGDLDAADTLVSTIKLSKTPIYGFALGMVASAASLIYLACHKRYALPNAYFIFHKGSCQNISGDFTNVQNAMEDYRKQIEKLENFYIESTQFPEEVIREKIKSDWYIHVPEALKYGVVNDLIENIELMF